jgi:hypothetical protein
LCCCRVTHSIELPPAAPQQPPPAAVAAPPALAAAAAAAAPSRERKRAAGSPMAGTKQRFRRLLNALACRRSEELEGVDSNGNK